MVAYQILDASTVKRTGDDGSESFGPPNEPTSAFSIAYQAWLALGNTPQPAPLRFVRAYQLPEKLVRTAAGQTLEILRTPVPPKTELSGLLQIRGLTDDRANYRAIFALVKVGRNTGNAVVLQTRLSPANATILADHAIGTGGAWTPPTVAVAGTEVVISVVGPAGVAVNWVLTGSYETFNFEGD